MADEATLPTEEEIAQLPRWARVAFAARCARRALVSSAQRRRNRTVSQDYGIPIIKAIEGAELAAIQGRDTIDSDLVTMLPAVPEDSVMNAVADAAAAAAASVSTVDPLRAAARVSRAMRTAVTAGVESQEILVDFQRLIKVRHLEGWADDAPVPPSVFGSLDGPVPRVNLTDTDLTQVWRDYRAHPTVELRNRLLENYLPLVKYNAERIWQRLTDGVDLDDLMSAGTFGLMDAIDAFDLERGVKFETYCVPRIRGAMLDELRSMGNLPAKTIVLEAFAPEGTSPHVIGDSLVKLWEAANEYHMAGGGGVLTFDEFKQMMPALVPVGPQSEG